MADHHHHHLQSGGGNNSGVVMRDFRKGNWTIQETMILIEAKKMDDERRMKRTSSSSIGVGGESSSGNVGNNKPTELRWKWVEDYCWRKGCCRSQNQCNDKWDNLMRDYKKVRDYERKITNHHHHHLQSYWKIEKNERKEKNLPSNLLHQIYDALVEVVERKGSSSSSSAQAQPQVLTIAAAPVPAAATGGYGNDINSNAVQLQIQPQLHPPLLQQPHIFSVSAVSTPLALPLPPLMAATPISTAQPPPPPPPALPTTMCDSSGSDTSEYTYSPAKRRRKRRSTTTKTGGGGGEGTSSGHGHNHEEVGSAISKSASIIAEAIQASEEREERRHKDLLNLHERRLKIEESKTEVNRQGINGLVDAINKLANSILALASNNNNQSPPK